MIRNLDHSLLKARNLCNDLDDAQLIGIDWLKLRVLCVVGPPYFRFYNIFELLQISTIRHKIYNIHAKLR